MTSPNLDTLMQDIAHVVQSEESCASPAATLAALGDVVQRMAAYGSRRDDPIRTIFARLGDKWSTLILLVLQAGRFRHATLKRLAHLIGADRNISQRMLTLRLRSLEREGFIQRHIIPGKVVHVEYELTVLGQELFRRYYGLLRWLEDHSDEFAAARHAFNLRYKEE